MFSGVAFWVSPTEEIAGLTYGRFAASRRTTGTNQRAMWSNDGITWNIATTPNSYNYFSIDFSPELGLYCAVASDAQTNNIMTSTNSVTWTARSKSNNAALGSVRWCNAFNRFIAHGVNNLWSSTDGITWTIALTASDTTFEYISINSMYEDSKTVYAIGETKKTGTGAAFLNYTTDGVNFSRVQIGTDTFWTGGDIRSIVYSPVKEQYMIVNQTTSSRILTAATYSDQNSWSWYTQSVAPSGALRISHTYGDGYWVSPMWSGASTTTPIQYSSEGTVGTWTASTFASAAYGLYDIVYAKEIDLFFIVRSNAANGFSSPDGVTWTQRTVSGTEFVSVTWGPGVRTNGYKQGSGIT